MKFIKSLFLVFILLTTVMNFAFSQTAADNQSSDSTKIVTVKVKGITCSKDLKMISDNVEKVEGVSTCKTVKKGTTTIFNVAFNPVLVSKDDIHAAIVNTSSCNNPNIRPYKIKQ